VELFNKAVMNFNGPAKFYIPKDFGPFVGEGSSLIKSKFNNIEKLTCVSIECINFIEFLTKIKKEFDDVFIVVKMDIEGSEYNIIDELYRNFTLNRVRLIDYLMVEFHPNVLSDPFDNSHRVKLENMNTEYTEWF